MSECVGVRYLGVNYSDLIVSECVSVSYLGVNADTV